jgi:hypothetical protein
MSATTFALKSPPPPVPVIRGSAVMQHPVFGLQVGTGGDFTIDYLKIRGSKGYPYFAFGTDPELHATQQTTASPAANLAHIRSVLQPSVTDLAWALGVSRQAVYDWQAGRPIAPDNVARLQDIARAADLFVREGLRATAHMMRRPIKSGKNFFELIRDGGSPEVAAQILIDIVRDELNQRESLRSKLSDRAPPTREDFQNLGTPMLDEKG